MISEMLSPQQKSWENLSLIIVNISRAVPIQCLVFLLSWPELDDVESGPCQSEALHCKWSFSSDTTHRTASFTQLNWEYSYCSYSACDDCTTLSRILGPRHEVSWIIMEVSSLTLTPNNLNRETYVTSVATDAAILARQTFILQFAHRTLFPQIAFSSFASTCLLQRHMFVVQSERSALPRTVVDAGAPPFPAPSPIALDAMSQEAITAVIEKSFVKSVWGLQLLRKARDLRAEKWLLHQSIDSHTSTSE